MGKVIIRSRIHILLAERRMNQRDLATVTGLSTRLISELVNDKNKTFSREALEKVMAALNVTEMNELFEVIIEE